LTLVLSSKLGIEGLIKNAAVAAAIDDFTRDFESLCGKGVTMKDAN
jgi:hypothetical protein